MQWDYLRYFVVLANTKSFYGAAKKLYISHQGLNRAITSLEEELDVKLLERSASGVRLTTRGEIFFDYAQNAIAQHDAMLDELYAEHRLASKGSAPLVFRVTYYVSQISRPIISSMGADDAVSLIEEGFTKIVSAASKSDGSELFLADLNCETEKLIQEQNNLAFEPLVISQLGLVWKEGSPFSKQRVIHREQLENFPLAIDSHREMNKLIDTVMEGRPLRNIRLGVAEPRNTLKYAATSNQVAATFDSFGFCLMQANSSIDTEGLHFTPMATPRSICKIGFLYAIDSKPNMRVQHAMDRLKNHLKDCYPDYFKRYPLY